MALTDIARKLKETFEGFRVESSLDEDLKRFRAIYGDAEDIRIGEMDYIVINEVYRTDEEDGSESISPLFFMSLNNRYAIIDAETSSTLIDEVYSRVTYMQRVCRVETTPDKTKIRNSLRPILGDIGEKLGNERLNKEDVNVFIDAGDDRSNKANIFQCHLIKDTGVSAAPDVYSFMLKNGEVKEISDSVMRQIKRTGEVNLLKDRDTLNANKESIQKAVFDKYVNADIDIQNVNVKSIFEISLSFLNVHLMYKDVRGREAVYNTSYLADNNNEFDSLNASIHVCDSCGHDIVDVDDPSKVHKIHVNTDAIDPEYSTEDKLVFLTGCEDCLVRCEKCGGWHFDYEKFMGSPIYSKIKLAPGREFIKGLRAQSGINYCSCREGTEWVYDEKSGTAEEHGVIPVEKMVFINYACEKIATYADYLDYCKQKRGNENFANAKKEHEYRMKTLAKFREELAKKFGMDIRDIILTSEDRCRKCSSCGGEYYKESSAVSYAGDADFRCPVCEEMAAERLNTVTRIDGVVFMRKKKGNGYVVKKYIVTRLGNLKEIKGSATPDTEEGNGEE